MPLIRDGRCSQLFIDATWQEKPTTGVEQLSGSLIRAIDRMGLQPKLIESSYGWLVGQFLTIPIKSAMASKAVFVYPFLPPLGSVYWKSCLTNIVFVHDLVPLENRSTAGLYTRLVASQTLRSAINRADHLLVATDALATVLRRHHRSVTVWRPMIPNVFNVIETATQADDYLLFIGTVEPRKNINYLVKIAGELRRAGSKLRIKVVGRPGWGEPPPEDPAVDILGYVDKTRLKSLIEGASLFITASKHEGIGLPILEVAHAGLPAAFFREAIPVEVAPKAAVALTGNARDDAHEIISCISSTSKMRLARADAVEALRSWNARATKSNERLQLLLEGALSERH